MTLEHKHKFYNVTEVQQQLRSEESCFSSAYVFPKCLSHNTKSYIFYSKDNISKENSATLTTIWVKKSRTINTSTIATSLGLGFTLLHKN